MLRISVNVYSHVVKDTLAYLQQIMSPEKTHNGED